MPPAHDHNTPNTFTSDYIVDIISLMPNMIQLLQT
jgi:hypothetical protein